MRRAALLAAAAGLAAGVMAETGMPVASGGNPLFLNGIRERPWWDEAWEWRMPIVVSEMSTNLAPNHVVEAEIDLGKAGQAESVRVVTPWEEEIDSWAEDCGGTKVRLYFSTTLRAAENKPFFVYFGNAAAKRKAPDVNLRARADGKKITLANDAITLEFSRETQLPTALTRFKINRSPSESELATITFGFAQGGLTPGLRDVNRETFPFTNRVELTCDNPYKKAVRLENDYLTFDYALWAGTARLDYRLKIKQPKKHWLDDLTTGWSAGTGCAWDDIYYPSLSGKVRTVRAMLDYRSDSGGNLEWRTLGEFSAEGWYLIRDRKTQTGVGQYYSPEQLSGMSHGYSGGFGGFGEWMRLGYWSTRPEEVRGAAFASEGDWRLAQRGYGVWANPPKVIYGEAEARRKVEVKRPDMAKDFTCDMNVPFLGMPMDERGRFRCAWKDWTKAYVRRLRKLGCNAVRLTGPMFHQIEMDKPLYEETMNLVTNSVATWRKGDGRPWLATTRTWEDSQRGAKVTKELMEALQRDGQSVYAWSTGVGHVPIEGQFYGPWRENQLKIETASAEFGFDAVWCGLLNHEGPMIDPELKKKNSNEYWKWGKEAKDEFFKCLDAVLDHARESRRRMKAVRPDAKLLTWGCDLGSIHNEMNTIELAGECDVVMQEMMDGSGGAFERTKFGIARIRAMFNNKRCTAYNHFWARYAGDDWRIGNCDMPFAFGANGFTQENEEYAYVDPENIETTGDFYRFAFGTGLNRVVEKMTMKKDWAILRDARAHRGDLYANRYKNGFCDQAQSFFTHTDGMASFWSTSLGLQADLVLDKYFTPENLEGYRVLVLPHNRQLTEADLETVKKFVEKGGICYADGAEFPFAKFFTEGAKDADARTGLKWREYGKGKLFYSPQELSMARHTILGVRERIRKICGMEDTVSFESPYWQFADAMVRTDGERHFIGTYAKQMPGGTGAVVRLKVNFPVKEGSVVVDVKNGTASPYTGTIEYRQEHRQCSYFLIAPKGDGWMPEAKTAARGEFAPEGAPGMMKTAEKNLKEREKLGDFKRAKRAVVFLPVWSNGNVPRFTRYKRLLVDEKPVVAEPEKLKERLKVENLEEWQSKNPDVLSFRKGEAAALLEGAELLHLKAGPEEYDIIFRECGEEIKAMLARGGAVLFDCQATSPAAKKLLEEVGVFDPNTDGGRLVRWGDMADSMNSVFTKDKKHPIWCVPEPLDKPWTGKFLFHEAVYKKWDKAKQWVPFAAKEDANYAMMVMQEGVCGKGKVCFSENPRAWTDWYESETFSNNMTSYLLGMSAFEHIRKVELLNGGPGKDAVREFEK